MLRGNFNFPTLSCYGRGGKNRGVENRAPVRDFCSVTPTPGAINPRADGQTGASEQGFGKGRDRRLGAGRVQGNVAKGDRGNAGGVRSGCGVLGRNGGWNDSRRILNSGSKRKIKIHGAGSECDQFFLLRSVKVV